MRQSGVIDTAKSKLLCTLLPFFQISKSLGSLIYGNTYFYVGFEDISLRFLLNTLTPRSKTTVFILSGPYLVLKGLLDKSKYMGEHC